MYAYLGRYMLYCMYIAHPQVSRLHLQSASRTARYYSSLAKQFWKLLLSIFIYFSWNCLRSPFSWIFPFPLTFRVSPSRFVEGLARGEPSFCLRRATHMNTNSSSSIVWWSWGIQCHKENRNGGCADLQPSLDLPLMEYYTRSVIHPRDEPRAKPIILRRVLREARVVIDFLFFLFLILSAILETDCDVMSQ